MCYTMMLGLGQEYIAKLAQSVGMDDRLVGLIEPVPMLLATLVQQFSVLAVIRARSYQRIVWVSAAFQAVMLFALAILAGWSSMRESAPAAPVFTAGLFLLVSAYYIGAFFGSPAWMAMMGLAIPDRVMPRYLGRRTLILHMTLLIGLLGGGYALQLAASGGNGALLRVLAFMFALAGVARCGSAFFLSRYGQPAFEPPVVVSPREVVRRVHASADGKALTFLVVMQAAMWVAFPFFRPYMLTQLGARDGPASSSAAPADTTTLYAYLLAAFWIGKAIAPELAGRAVHRFGLLPVTWASAIALIPAPLLWLVSPNPGFLLIAQFISGSALAAFELCSMLLQMEHVPIRERASVLSTFGLGLYAAGFFGSLLGGYLLGEHATPASYATVFAASTVLRMASLLLLLRVREHEPNDGEVAPGPSRGVRASHFR